MSSSIRRAGHSNWIIGGIAALAVAGLLASLVAVARQHSESQRIAQVNQQRLASEAAIINGLRSDVECITTWANTYTSSTRRVQALATHRVDLLFTALNAAVRAEQARSLQLYREAARASVTYHRYVAKHPIPALRLACTVPTLPASPTHRPAAGHGATVTVPGPTVTAPGPTTTITRPGATVTVHAPPRTVTVTTTAPPGKARGRSRKP